MLSLLIVAKPIRHIVLPTTLLEIAAASAVSAAVASPRASQNFSRQRLSTLFPVPCSLFPAIYERNGKLRGGESILTNDQRLIITQIMIKK